MRREWYDDVGLFRVVELTPYLYERWERPDFVTPVESRPPTATELERLEEEQDLEEASRAGYGAQLKAAAQNIIATTPNGNDIITLFVGLGLVPPKAAKSAGWTPPV